MQIQNLWIVWNFIFTLDMIICVEKMYSFKKIMIRSTKPCHRNELSEKFEIHYAKQWENISVSKLTDFEDKQFSDINYRVYT